MDLRHLILVGLLLLIFTFVAGCTQSPPVAPAAPTETPTPVMTPEKTPVQTETPTLAPTPTPSPFDGPVAIPPGDLSVSVTAQKDPIYQTITITFDGGLGQDLVQDIDVRILLSTGEEIIKPLPSDKGATILVNGTKESDEVQVIVYYMNGQSFKTYDETLGGSRISDPEINVNKTAEADMTTGGIFEGPVTQPPNSLSTSVDLQKDPVYRVITATFRGGHGQSLISSVKVHAILSSGEVQTLNLTPDMGAIVEIQGTDGTDRIQVVVQYKNGDVYKITDTTLGPRG